MSLDLANRTTTQPHTTGDSPPPPVRVGVIGAGQQSTTHLLPALLQIPNARVTALVDPITARRDVLADRFGVSARLTTVQELLHSGLVDCVVAACPPQAHEEVAAAAIAAATPVFLEKPPATSTTALAALADTATRRDVITGVGMNFRWAAPMRQLHDLLADGRHGSPTMITVRHVASKPVAPMWDMSLWRSFLLAQAIHPIDLMLALAESPVLDIQAAYRCHDASIWLGLQLRHANGVLTTLAAGNQASRFEHRVEVNTTTGITASLTRLADLTVTGPGVLATGQQHRGTGSQWRPSTLDVGYDRTGFGGELDAFCIAVATATPFTPSLADLLPTYQVMDQLNPTATPIRSIR